MCLMFVIVISRNKWVFTFFGCVCLLCLQELCAGVVRSIAARCSVPKVMLQLLKQKPKSIKFYEPKFDEE